MAETKNKLPKELQTFKKEMKKATFEEKIERYFSISYVIEEYSGQKKDIIMSLFSPLERYTFDREYYPIRKTIATYEDKVRTIKSVIDFTAYYIDSLLRLGGVYTYMGEFTDYALQYLKEVTGDTDCKVARHLKSLRSITPGFNLSYDGESNSYVLRSDGFIEEIETNIKELQKGLSLIKAYFESLREFLKTLEKPELFPKEFERAEKQLISRFDNRYAKTVEDADKDPKKEKDYPKLRTATDLEKKVISIDYEETEPTAGYMGKNNIWLKTYISLVGV